MPVAPLIRKSSVRPWTTLVLCFGADGGSRTRTGSPPQDFKSCVSTSSTTSAGRRAVGIAISHRSPPFYLPPILPATSATHAFGR